MNHRIRLIGLLAVSLLACGCIHTIEYGRQFDSSRVASLEKGKTTKQEILTMFAEAVRQRGA